MVHESNISEFIGNSDLNTKIEKFATKAELKVVQDKIAKLQAFDPDHFLGKIHFEDNETQNFLVFQPLYRFFKNIGSTDYISAWKSKGLYDENIKAPATSDNILAPSLIQIGI